MLAIAQEREGIARPARRYLLAQVARDELLDQDAVVDFPQYVFA